MWYSFCEGRAVNIKEDFLNKYEYYFKDKPDFCYEAILKSVFDIVSFYKSVCKDELYSAEMLGNINLFKDKKTQYNIEEVVFNRLYSNINKVVLDEQNSHKYFEDALAFYDANNKEIFIDVNKVKENTSKIFKSLTVEQKQNQSFMDKIKRFSIVHELLHAISDDRTANFIFNKKQKLNELITEDITIKVLGLNCLHLMKAIRFEDETIYILNTNSRSGYGWGNGIATLLNSIPNFNPIRGYVVNSINSEIAYENYVKDFSQSLNRYKVKNARSVYFEGLVNAIEKIHKLLKSNSDREKALKKIITLQTDLLLEYNRNIMGELSLKSLQSLTKKDINNARKEIDNLKYQLTLVLGDNSKNISIDKFKKDLKGTSIQLKDLVKNNILKLTSNLKVMIEIEECMERIEKSSYVKKNINKENIKNNENIKENLSK